MPKPRISVAAMNRAENLVNTGKSFLIHNLRSWLRSYRYWKSVKSLQEINRCRREVIEDVMALEIIIKRPHWYRRSRS